MAAVQVRTSPSAVTVYVSGSTVMFGRASLSFMSDLVSFLTMPIASTLLLSMRNERIGKTKIILN